MTGFIIAIVVGLIITMGAPQNRVLVIVICLLVAFAIGLINPKDIINKDLVATPKVDDKASNIPPFEYQSGISFMDFTSTKEDIIDVIQDGDWLGFSSVKGIPDDISKMAESYAEKYRVEPAVFLAIAWHERAGRFGWYDNYVFGYGAYDVKPWAGRFAGWENQWKNAAPKIGKFFSRNQPSKETFQIFARDIYKTTAWKNYGSAFEHYRKFKKRTVIESNNLAVLGDSIADGITTSLKGRNEVMDYAKPSRNIFFPWEKVINQLPPGTKTYMLVGANDILKDSRKYEERVNFLMNTANSRGIKFIWLGVPNLPRRDLAKRVPKLNEIFARQAEKNNVRFVTMDHFKSDAPDAVHFTMKGYQEMANYIEKFPENG